MTTSNTGAGGGVAVGSVEKETRGEALSGETSGRSEGGGVAVGDDTSPVRKSGGGTGSVSRLPVGWLVSGAVSGGRDEVSGCGWKAVVMGGSSGFGCSHGWAICAGGVMTGSKDGGGVSSGKAAPTSVSAGAATDGAGSERTGAVGSADVTAAGRSGVDAAGSGANGATTNGAAASFGVVVTSSGTVAGGVAAAVASGSGMTAGAATGGTASSSSRGIQLRRWRFLFHGRRGRHSRCEQFGQFRRIEFGRRRADVWRRQRGKCRTGNRRRKGFGRLRVAQHRRRLFRRWKIENEIRRIRSRRRRRGRRIERQERVQIRQPPVVHLRRGSYRGQHRRRDFDGRRYFGRRIKAPDETWEVLCPTRKALSMWPKALSMWPAGERNQVLGSVPPAG